MSIPGPEARCLHLGARKAALLQKPQGSLRLHQYWPVSPRVGVMASLMSVLPLSTPSLKHGELRTHSAYIYQEESYCLLELAHKPLNTGHRLNSGPFIDDVQALRQEFPFWGRDSNNAEQHRPLANPTPVARVTASLPWNKKLCSIHLCPTLTEHSNM